MSRKLLIAKRSPPAARRILSWVAVALALASTLYVGVYIHGTRSNAFQFSRQWLQQSSEAQARVGEVNDVRLSFWGGYSEDVSSNFHSARLTAEVSGDRGESEVELALRKEGDEWVVVSCQFR
jgi:hypothetical protein